MEHRYSERRQHFSQFTTLMAGTNTVSTIAMDQAGNTTTDARTITLDQTAPAIIYEPVQRDDLINTSAQELWTSMLP
jgi:hypothetical protein